MTGINETTTDELTFIPMEIGLDPQSFIVTRSGRTELMRVGNSYRRHDPFKIFKSPRPLLQITKSNLSQLSTHFGSQYVIDSFRRQSFLDLNADPDGDQFILIALKQIHGFSGSYGGIGDWVDSTGAFYDKDLHWKPVGTYESHKDKSMGFFL